VFAIGVRRVWPAASRKIEALQDKTGRGA